MHKRLWRQSNEHFARDPNFCRFKVLFEPSDSVEPERGPAAVRAQKAARSKREKSKGMAAAAAGVVGVTCD